MPIFVIKFKWILFSRILRNNMSTWSAMGNKNIPTKTRKRLMHFNFKNREYMQRKCLKITTVG